MTKLSLSIALQPYEHAIDLLTDRVSAEGVDLNWLRISGALGQRFAERREFDGCGLALLLLLRLPLRLRSWACLPWAAAAPGAAALGMP